MKEGECFARATDVARAKCFARVQARGFMNKQHITRRQKDDVYKKMNTKFDEIKNPIKYLLLTIFVNFFVNL